LSQIIKQQFKMVGNGKHDFFSQLGALLPKATAKPLGFILPDIHSDCQGMFAIVRSAL